MRIDVSITIKMFTSTSYPSGKAPMISYYSITVYKSGFHMSLNEYQAHIVESKTVLTDH